MSEAWTKRAISVPDLPNEGRSYEQCIVAGNLIFIAGQTGSPETPLFETQTREAFVRIRKALQSAGADLKDLVAMTVFITDMRYRTLFGTIRKELLGESLATSAMIGVSQLYDPRILVEIQSIAVKSHE